MTIANLALILLPLEFWILYKAQRELFWHFDRLVAGKRWLTYLLVMPSTVAHELAHAVMALILNVPFGRRAGGEVKLFSPQRDEKTGGVQLGYVSVAVKDPLRNSLISIAPAILVPIFFWLITWALLGSGNPIDAIDNLKNLPGWRVGTWALIAALLPLAAFPSVGDYVSPVGAMSLAALTFFAGWMLYRDGGVVSILSFVTGWSNLLLVPAVIAAIILIMVRSK